MDPIELNKPFISEELAIELASKLYGLKVISVKEMVSYDDKNFHIKVSNQHSNPYIENVSSDGYTLKITNTQKSALPGHYDSMHKTLFHLKKKGLRTPQPVKNLDGATWTFETVPVHVRGSADHVATGRCGVHLLTFIPGVCIGTVNHDESLLKQWGSLLAQFQIAMEDFSSPILDKKTIFWDLSHVPEIVRFMDGLEEDKAKLVHSVLARHPRELDEPTAPIRRGYIHADFNDNNVLCSVSETGHVVDGILDLEDIYRGPFVWDVALMMAYASLYCADLDPVDGMGCALKGYLQFRDMSDTELSYLKICIASRLAQSLVMGAYFYRQNPGNEYLLESSRTGWSRLEQIWRTPDEALMKKWKSVRPNYS